METRPERPAHGFTYTPTDMVGSYTPPVASGTGLLGTTYGYDPDGALAQVLLPDESTILPGYDAAGRLASMTTSRGTTVLGYDDQGRLETLAAPDGEIQTFGYDGVLPKSETRAGAVAGTVGWGYDNDFRVSSVSVNGAAVSYQYDPDGLLIQAGALAVSREPTTGRISGSTVTTSQSYDGYGALATFSASASGVQRYAYTLTPDAAGRIASKSETVLGTSHGYVYGYGYDDAGRLATVTVDGALARTYRYDANGNRLEKTGAAGVEVGVPDDQDRLLSYGAATYTYRPNGDLESRTVAGQTTWYSYDAQGNLVAVALPNGTAIEYLIDGQSRRVGKKVNGQLVEGFLYEGQLRPAAWLNGAGEVYARFVYGTRVNAPEYMVTAAGTFRIVTDHLGSPRLVVNASTGAVVERIDYDEWGRVLADTNPGFQPFGFAGGLYDRDTGLVRFGARDYDPQTGRWTNKNPIRFNGGTTNLYEYVANDPVNFIDSGGLACFDAGNWRRNHDQKQAMLQKWCADGSMLACIYGWLDSIFAHPPSPTDAMGMVGIASAPRFSPDQSALISLAKEAQRTGVNPAEAQTLLNWAKEYNVAPALDHTGTTHWVGGDHIRIGPVNHIPVGP